MTAGELIGTNVEIGRTVFLFYYSKLCVHVCCLFSRLSTHTGGFSTTSTTWEARVYCMLQKCF